MNKEQQLEAARGLLMRLVHLKVGDLDTIREEAQKLIEPEPWHPPIPEGQTQLTYDHKQDCFELRANGIFVARCYNSSHIETKRVFAAFAVEALSELACDPATDPIRITNDIAAWREWGGWKK